MEQREQENLRRQKRELAATMASGREESRLEVRLDMLLGVGDAIQRACRSDRSEGDRLGEVARTLARCAAGQAGPKPWKPWARSWRLTPGFIIRGPLLERGRP